MAKYLSYQSNKDLNNNKMEVENNRERAGERERERKFSKIATNHKIE